ncbi:unnamed protein product [Cercopithifilaria johnstoni]|uniref:ShKT domain-containing protein n=1 Tax=Cercopithifilaria johnstoni TaxID=2874296 RepID=A0A8J2MUB4_9BILA|nr:unnamed protein product [Cercopithifilaria johnstoni]
MIWILFIAFLLSFSIRNRQMAVLCTCVDLAPPNQPSSCPQLTHLCNDSLYRELMKMQCPKTCGHCSENVTSTVTSSTCQDKAPPNAPSQCPNFILLCNNPIYRDLMIQECPKTCSRC